MRVPITKKPATVSRAAGPVKPMAMQTKITKPVTTGRNATPNLLKTTGAAGVGVTNTPNGLTYQTGDKDRKQFSVNGSTIRMAPNSSFTPSIPKPPKRNILQDLMILLKGGQLTPQPPSNVLGVRG